MHRPLSHLALYNLSWVQFQVTEWSMDLGQKLIELNLQQKAGLLLWFLQFCMALF